MRVHLMKTERKPWAEFVAYDLFGNEYNCKYPPNKDQYGLDFEGYATPNQLTFFYDFCINQYGVAFHFGGNDYEVEFTDKGPVLTNRTTGDVQGPFKDAVDLLENSNLNGCSIVSAVDKLENVVIH